MPSAEVLSIGTELLLGQVLDTNAQFMAIELARLGLNSFFRTTVGDNKERIKECLKRALERSDIVITTGGLGPTPDDLTTECIAELLEAKMEMDETVVERVRAFFRTRGYPMPESNAKQGLRPIGAEILPNPIGTAPGIIFALTPERLSQVGIKAETPRLILTFPGVPSEMKGMWRETAEPLLFKKFGGTTLWSCELKHYGIGESALAEQYRHLLDMENPTVAPYAGRGECRLRVTARGSSVEEAQRVAMPVVEEIRRGSKHRLYGTDDDLLETAVGRLLIERGFTISAAESCSGGLISTRLTDIPGSSKYVNLNLVTYSNEAKVKLLGVSEELLAEHGAVSAECARAMAEGVRRLTGASVGVSTTGIAGPDGGSEDKPVGLVYLGISAGDDFYRSNKFLLPANFSRNEIRFRTASEALNMVRLYLLNPQYPR
ncbi:MAG TPA: competence/damage-inducible protein A [Planktothrix sp.]|jgi:nicotinamide-nucleotide amidase